MCNLVFTVGDMINMLGDLKDRERLELKYIMQKVFKQESFVLVIGDNIESSCNLPHFRLGSND